MGIMMNTFNENQLEQFESGLSAGLDPDNQQKSSNENSPAQHVTTLRSRWLHRRCSICGHSFRLGDEISVQIDGNVVHDMAGLRCAGGSDGVANNSDNKLAFFRGLDEAWCAPAGTCIERLDENHYLLAYTRNGRIRPSCRICGHTFRPGDLVVICPCRPSLKVEGRKCIAAVHRDTMNQLHCLDDWEKVRSKDTCLGMS